MVVGVPTEREVIIFRELVIPLMDKLSSLLLRSGAFGFWQFHRNMLARCMPENHPHNPLRINPEDLKSVLYECGVALTPDEYKQISQAYSDDIGFILVDPFFDAMCPAFRLPDEQLDRILRLFPPIIAGENGEDRSGGVSCPSSPLGSKGHSHESKKSSDDGLNPSSSPSFTLPDVRMESLWNVLLYLFAPEGDHQTRCNENSSSDGEVAASKPPPPPIAECQCSDNEEENDSISRALQVCYEEAALIFCHENYPQERVRAVEAINVLAAELLLHQNNFGVLSSLLSRLERSPVIDAALIAVVRKTKQGNPIINPIGYSMVHTGLRWTRLFERYMNEDRRDEWLRGREEREARPTYMKHTCGFAGHLPEYKRHFGRTFHTIEENLLVLSKPRGTPCECCLRPDRFGPGRILKDNRNAHHYRLA